MTIQLNLSAIAIAGQAAWRRAKPLVVRDVVIRAAIGCLGIIILWLIIAIGDMPTAR